MKVEGIPPKPKGSKRNALLALALGHVALCSLTGQPAWAESGSGAFSLALPILIAAAGGAGLAAAYLIVSQRKTKQRLSVVIENIKQLTEGGPLAPPVDGSDEIAQIDRAIHTLASELKRIAQQERTAVDNAMDVICSIDNTGTFTAASPGSIELFGYEPEQLIGKTLDDFIVDEDAESTCRAIDKFMAGSSISSFENRIRTRSGKVIDIKWSARWSEREHALYWIAHDITERKMGERLKRDLVAMVSHDLRTPLMSAQASLTLLSVGALGKLTDKADFNVKDAERNIAYVINLINGLLDVEKISSGKLKLKKAEFNLADALKRSVDMVKPLAEQNRITISLPEASVNCVADETRIVQVVVNLLSNAVKYAGENTSVRIEVHEQETDVEVKVIDTGGGIDTSQKEKIFERFERLDSDGSGIVGSGLGLSICKAIIEEHGGAIGVESEPGAGSAFWFKIPLGHSE
ncbi:MAG TPA: PAS domain-containing sensor histidine kinase [Candidatus Obscuribacterales bacterium]